jgi:hypothetical protein
VGFDETIGDELLEATDPDLATQMREVFLTLFLDVSADVFDPDDRPPQVVIYRRPSMQELRIDGPRQGQEWCTNPWTGNAREALTFAEDAGVAAAF